MITSLIFDIGNVLLPFDFAVALGRLEQRCGIPSATVMQLCRPVMIAFESGQIGRAEFLRQVTAILKFVGTEEEFIAIWQDIFTENVPMSELVRSLHGRFPLYLLSNTNEIHVGYFTRVYSQFECFSGAVYSHVAKCMKPRREIYEIAAKQFGVAPAGTLFIDDIAENVEGAREFGFQAIQYDLKRHGEFLDALKALGIAG